MLYQLSYSRNRIHSWNHEPRKITRNPHHITRTNVSSPRFFDIRGFRIDQETGGGRRIRTFEDFTPTGLQPVPFGHSGTPPQQTLPFVAGSCDWSWRWDLNPRPADYKSAALPTELRQHPRIQPETESQTASSATNGQTLIHFRSERVNKSPALR